MLEIIKESEELKKPEDLEELRKPEDLEELRKPENLEELRKLENLEELRKPEESEELRKPEESWIIEIINAPDVKKKIPLRFFYESRLETVYDSELEVKQYKIILSNISSYFREIDFIFKTLDIGILTAAQSLSLAMAKSFIDKKDIDILNSRNMIDRYFKNSFGYHSDKETNKKDEIFCFISDIENEAKHLSQKIGNEIKYHVLRSYLNSGEKDALEGKNTSMTLLKILFMGYNFPEKNHLFKHGNNDFCNFTYNVTEDDLKSAHKNDKYPYEKLREDFIKKIADFLANSEIAVNTKEIRSFVFENMYKSNDNGFFNFLSPVFNFFAQIKSFFKVLFMPKNDKILIKMIITSIKSMKNNNLEDLAKKEENQSLSC